MKKFILIIIIIIVAAAVWFYQKNSGSDGALAPSPAGNSAEIVNEVENIDLGDTDSEFKEIDQDLNSL
ncbi:MAG: hypothetical protein HYT66_01685 [Candidatus Yanofskybacteria bacterium]|nr:hypothetical protein [Candidatus Yanofskybacteria bacterium]